VETQIRKHTHTHTHARTHRERTHYANGDYMLGFSGELGFLDSDLFSYWKGFHIYTSPSLSDSLRLTIDMVDSLSSYNCRVQIEIWLIDRDPHN